MAVDINPQGSSTYKPGFIPNEAPYGSINNQQYVTALTEFLASMWAYGGESRQQALNMMSPVWYSAKFGEPDPTDQGGIASPRTLLAFSRFASEYQGGSPLIDQTMPYIPKGPNDFIESPEQTAIRIGQANFERELDQQLAMQANQIAAAAQLQASSQAWQSGENAQDRALSAAQTNAQIQAQMESIKANLKAQAMDAFNSAFGNEISKYSVEAGIYNNQQSIQSSNLQQAGSLSSIFQQILDERTNKAIEAQLNPGDYLARESQVRAMTAPQGTTNPAYQNYDVLTKIIEMLMNTQGGTKPTAPDQNTFVPPEALQDLMDYEPTAPAPVTAGGGGSFSGGGGTSGGGQYATAEDAIAALLAQGYGDPSQRAAAGLGASTQQTTIPYTEPINRELPADYTYGVPMVAAAYGMQNKRVAQFMSGDPQADGKPNPEVVTIHNPGPKTRVSVDPVKNMAKKRKMKKFAYGTDMFDPNTLQLKSYSDEDYQNMPSLKYLQGGLSKSKYNTLATGNTTGAFGQQLPESGSINYGRYLDLAKDPVSLAMVASSYKSGSRDLFAEVARAKARAPFGSAVQTSLIRT